MTKLKDAKRVIINCSHVMHVTLISHAPGEEPWVYYEGPRYGSSSEIALLNLYSALLSASEVLEILFVMPEEWSGAQYSLELRPDIRLSYCWRHQLVDF